MKLHGPPFDSVIEEMVYNIVMGGEALAFESIAVGSTRDCKMLCSQVRLKLHTLDESIQ